MIGKERKELDICDVIERTISRKQREVKSNGMYIYGRKSFDCIIYCQIADIFQLEAFSYLSTLFRIADIFLN